MKLNQIITVSQDFNISSKLKKTILGDNEPTHLSFYPYALVCDIQAENLDKSKLNLQSHYLLKIAVKDLEYSERFLTDRMGHRALFLIPEIVANIEETLSCINLSFDAVFIEEGCLCIKYFSDKDWLTQLKQTVTLGFALDFLFFVRGLRIQLISVKTDNENSLIIEILRKIFIEEKQL